METIAERIDQLCKIQDMIDLNSRYLSTTIQDRKGLSYRYFGNIKKHVEYMIWWRTLVDARLKQYRHNKAILLAEASDTALDVPESLLSVLKRETKGYLVPTLLPARIGGIEFDLSFIN